MDRNTKPEILVPAIAMPEWPAKFEAENPGRVIPGDAEKVRFTVGIAAENVRHETGGPFAAAVFELGTDRLIAVGINAVGPLLGDEAFAPFVLHRKSGGRIY